MRVLGWNERALFEKTGTQTERYHSVQQRRSVQIVSCRNCFNFSTFIQADLIYSFVKQQNLKLKITNVKCVAEKFLGFFYTSTT